MKSNKGGFTLIELLVVIAIIGILAAIVLVSVRGTTGRARDARVQSNMQQLRTQALMLNDTDGSYVNFACGTIADASCTCANGEVDRLCDDIVLNDHQAIGNNLVIRRGTGNTNYCAYVQLQGTGQYWCIDSNLISKGYTAIPATCGAACTDCRCE